MSCFVNDLKKDDVIYGFSVDTQALEIYGVDKVVPNQIEIYGIIGEDDFYLNFPRDLDLENPILCKYQEEAWWIYSVNINALKPFIETEDWNWLKNIHLSYYFDEYLDIWSQTMKKLK